MIEHLLTVPEAARALRVTPWTLRKWLNEGTLQGVRPRPGGRWRVPQSALDRIAQTRGGAKSDEATAGTGGNDTPQARAAAILVEMRSGDKARRTAAIMRLTGSDEATIEIVTETAARSVEDYDGPEDDLSAWREVDLKPHFPDEAPDYLNGLYRADNILELGEEA